MAKSSDALKLEAIRDRLIFQIARLEANLKTSHDGSISSWMSRMIEETQMRTLMAVLDELEKM